MRLFGSDLENWYSQDGHQQVTIHHHWKTLYMKWIRWFCKILREFARFWKILQNSARYCNEWCSQFVVSWWAWIELPQIILVALLDAFYHACSSVLFTQIRVPKCSLVSFSNKLHCVRESTKPILCSKWGHFDMVNPSSKFC